MVSQAVTGLSEHSFHLNVTFVSVTGVMTLLSTCLVALRFISRSLTLSIKLDDWFCLLALIFSYGLLCTTALVTTVGHAGIHITQYKDPLVLERYFQITLADMVIYNVSVGLTKISILLFYRRIFSINKSFLFCNWVVTGLSSGACIAAVFGLIFSSDPVDAQWKFWEPSTTIHNKSFWIAMGAVNILLDVTILILPQPVVWRLKQTRRCRIMLSLVFSLGGFVCVTSIVRLVYMATIDVTDLTCTCSPSFFGRPSTLTTPLFRQDTFTVSGIWTTVETNMSIICACLPMIPSLFQHIRESRSTKGASTGWCGITRLRPFHSWKSLSGILGSVRYHAVGSKQELYNDVEAASPKRASNYWGDVAQVHAYTKLRGSGEEDKERPNIPNAVWPAYCFRVNSVKDACLTMEFS
ncbi:putative integral membrane protein [Aspergillus niger]|nr:putative integral membrane protein [Aspergillus niger]